MFDRNYVISLKSENAGIGVVFSCWDLLHAGHCEFLKFAKSNCDYLVAGLHKDPRVDRSWKNYPIMTLEERRIVLSSNKYVDAIVEYDNEKDHEDIVIILEPKRFFGSDYLEKESFTGDSLPFPIVYHDRSHGWSSSSLRRRVWEAENHKSGK